MDMATAKLKITTSDGTTKCFSETVGDCGVEYLTMDKAVHRLQEQSNAFLTVYVEKEKAMNLTNQSNGGADDNDDDDESSEDEEEDAGKYNQDQDRPPEKKPKL